MKLCPTCISLAALVLGGCQQPPQNTVDVEQVIVEGRLELVKYEGEGGEIVTLDFSENDSHPKGKLYRDFLVIVHEKKGPVEKSKSGGSEQKSEMTMEVIPTRLITSIKLSQKWIIEELEQ
jgi:hypothetical protein